MEERPPIAAAAATGDSDRISALPDAIIHNIHYRLDAPKQAARTSSMSRRWLHLWRSYPVLEFRDEEIDGGSAARHNKFAGFAAASLRRLSLCHENRSTLLDSFKLSLAKIRKSCPQIVAEGFALLLASALGAGNGSPLEIVVRSGWMHKFPEGLLSNCGRTKVLKLEGCDLNGVGSVSLHSLQVLHLNDVQITEQLLYDFMVNAPDLELLSLEYCRGIERLEVSASNFPKLKTLNIVTRAYGLGSEFELQLTEAPFLERLVFTEVGKQCKLRTISLFSAPKLKYLRIASYYRGEIARGDLDEFITKLPSLQVLEIYPIGLGYDPKLEFQLTSAPCLKTLQFRGTRGICELKIESRFAAPNLKMLKLNVLKGFTQSHLDDLIAKLPCLESLSLEFNDGSSRETSTIKILSDRLRVFKLRDSYQDKRDTLLELEIDAPNLVSAHYSGSRLRFPGKINVVNVSSECWFVVKGYDAPLIRTRLKCKWFLGLRQSLSTLSPFHLVMRLQGLDLSRQVKVDLGEVECSSPPLIIQHLQLEATLPKCPNIQNDNSSTTVQQSQSEISSLMLPDVQNGVAFLDGLFWACRPKLICITQDSDVNRWFAEFMYEQLRNKDAANCCIGAKCWRHELRDAKIEDAVHDNMEISKDELSPLAKLAKVSFILTWC